MESLVQLKLQNNRFEGRLPSEWHTMRYLDEFNVENNVGLFGPLPVSYNSWSEVTDLRLANCSFSGSIPLSWMKNMVRF